MKKFFTTFLLSFLMIFGVQAQGKKVVLIEHFTQASCPPCATQNPRIRPVVINNADKIAMIHHQTSWPGFDPMNQHNPGDVSTRVSYYGVRGVPSTVINGKIQGSPTSVVTQANVDQQYNLPTKMDLDLQVESRCNYSGLEIDIEVEASEALSGDLYLHVVVIEEEIDFGSPPGTNGETVFHNVLKKALPSSSGTGLNSDWAAGDKQSISFSYDFENFYDFTESAVVAFVQDRRTKEVFQAARWKPEFEASNGDDVSVQSASIEGDQICGGTAAPMITVMNTGSTNISSFDVEYGINGSTSTFSFDQRVIGKYRTMNVQLPEINFNPQPSNEISIKVLNANGNTDVNDCNDEITGQFDAAPSSTVQSVFRIYPRIRPVDLSFEILNSQGQVVAQGADFTKRNEWVEYNLNLNMDECYEIQVTNDANVPNALYELVNDQGNIMIKGNVATRGLHTDEFGTFVLTSNNDLHEVSNLSLSPNPGLNEFVITAELVEAVDVQIQVTDILGKTYHSAKANWSEGKSTHRVEMGSVPSGLYLVTVRNGNRLITKRWLKQ